MERIGIAASKMAKGNLFVYNLWVVLISFLCSLLIFLISGSTVLFALMIIAYVESEIMPFQSGRSWMSILSMCMVTLTIVVFIFNLCAISKNIKIKS